MSTSTFFTNHLPSLSLNFLDNSCLCSSVSSLSIILNLSDFIGNLQRIVPSSFLANILTLFGNLLCKSSTFFYEFWLGKCACDGMLTCKPFNTIFGVLHINPPFSFQFLAYKFLLPF